VVSLGCHRIQLEGSFEKFAYRDTKFISAIVNEYTDVTSYYLFIISHDT
jgi:hypothetical protein